MLKLIQGLSTEKIISNGLESENTRSTETMKISKNYFSCEDIMKSEV